MTIDESLHVKFEESNAFVKNIIEIDFLDKDIEKIDRGKTAHKKCKF